MSMTDTQYAWLTANVGPVERVDADGMYVRLVTLRSVAVEVLQGRLNGLLSGPSSVTIPGVISIDNGSTIRALQQQIALLLAGPEDPSAPDVVTGGGSTLTMVPLVSRWARAGAYVGRGIVPPYTVRQVNADPPA